MKHVSVILIAFLILTASARGAAAQTADTGLLEAQPCFVGTSLFTLMNLADDDEPPRFFQVFPPLAGDLAAG